MTLQKTVLSQPREMLAGFQNQSLLSQSTARWLLKKNMHKVTSFAEKNQLIMLSSFFHTKVCSPAFFNLETYASIFLFMIKFNFPVLISTERLIVVFCRTVNTNVKLVVVEQWKLVCSCRRLVSVNLCFSVA